MKYAEIIAAELGLRAVQVRAAIELLGEGEHHPPSSRGTGRGHGGADEVRLRNDRDRHEYLW